MDNESTQGSNPPSGHSTLGRCSLWLGVASIVLFAVGRVFVYGITGPIYRSLSDTYKDVVDVIETLAPFLSVICGLLTILMGRIAYRRSRDTDGNRKDRAVQVGIVLGILAFIPVCLSIGGYLLLALATGYQFS